MKRLLAAVVFRGHPFWASRLTFMRKKPLRRARSPPPKTKSTLYGRQCALINLRPRRTRIALALMSRRCADDGHGRRRHDSIESGGKPLDLGAVFWTKPWPLRPMTP